MADPRRVLEIAEAYFPVCYGQLQRGALEPQRCGLIDDGGLDVAGVTHSDDVVTFHLPTRAMSYRLLERNESLRINDRAAWFAVALTAGDHPSADELATIYPAVPSAQ